MGSRFRFLVAYGYSAILRNVFRPRLWGNGIVQPLFMADSTILCSCRSTKRFVSTTQT